VCARVLAAGCADPGACSACEEVRILTPDSCRASLDALESCAAVETFTCNSAGQAESPVCDPLSASWARCVAGVYPNAFGIANPDLTSCQFLRDGTSCGECLALSCCTPFAACVEDPSCASLSTCAEACAGDSACFQGCERAHPGGVLLYLSLLSCTLGSCTSC